jgi:hypothetical protein
MANQRQAEKDMAHAGQDAARKIGEETSRAARTVTDTGANVARAGAEMIQRNTETVQQAWESGSKITSKVTERSMDQFARAFGITGENAQHAAQQSSRNLETIVQSGTILANGMQTMLREWLEFARKRTEQNFGRFDALLHCRTPQELLAVQSEMVRDNLEDFVQSTKRIADISVQMADEALRKMTDSSLAPR